VAAGTERPLRIGAREPGRCLPRSSSHSGELLERRHEDAKLARGVAVRLTLVGRRALRLGGRQRVCPCIGLRTCGSCPSAQPPTLRRLSPGIESPQNQQLAEPPSPQFLVQPPPHRSTQECAPSSHWAHWRRCMCSHCRSLAGLCCVDVHGFGRDAASASIGRHRLR
jgi:hypothetical protein